MQPKSFLKSSEGSITSYDFKDIAGGEGYVTFYLMKDAAGYTLSSETLYSDVVSLKQAEPGAAPAAKQFDQTFTYTLNTNRVVNGSVIVTIMADSSFDSVCSIVNYFHVDFIRIRGGSETVIATGNTVTRTYDATPTNEFSNTIAIPVTNSVFVKGDKIGIRLQNWIYKTTGSTGIVLIIGFDPMNRTDIVNTQLTLTKSTVSIPFKIDN